MHNAGMAKKASTEPNPANHLRAWREHAGLTQDELGERIGTSGSVIHLLETGDRGLTHKWLVKLAPALGTTAGFLLDFHPNSLPASLLKELGAVPKEAQPQVLQILKTFNRTGTHD